MKIIFKDSTELVITDCNINFNTRTTVEDEQYTISVTIDSKDMGDVTMDSLKSLLTDDNISEMSIVSDTVTEAVNAKKLQSVSKTISDERHSISINMSMATN